MKKKFHLSAIYIMYYVYTSVYNSKRPGKQTFLHYHLVRYLEGHIKNTNSLNNNSYFYIKMDIICIIELFGT